MEKPNRKKEHPHCRLSSCTVQESCQGFRNGSIPLQQKSKYQNMEYMPYSNNPYLPQVRAKAVELVRVHRLRPSKAARYIGVHRSTLGRWLEKAPSEVGRIYEIPTRSSRPKSSPRKIERNIEERIREIRLEKGRCAEIIHAQIEKEGMKVSLSTVKRVLYRHGLIKVSSPWKKYHLSGERPKAEKAGMLVEFDTIHIMRSPQREEKQRIYIWTMLDCFSRWAYAQASERLNTYHALMMFQSAQKQAPFPFACIQSDHGPEFSQYFSSMIQSQGVRHRHSRVRKPNDNAHVERFNRTIQEEMKEDIIKYRANIPKLNDCIKEYMHYYNYQRLHLGLGCKTPMEMLQRC